MATPRAESRTVTAIADIAVGDGLYSKASDSVYWVRDISATEVVLRTADETTHTWLRETLEASFEAHTWVRQSTQPPSIDDSSSAGATS